jgi:hypothetical protein
MNDAEIKTNSEQLKPLLTEVKICFRFVIDPLCLDISRFDQLQQKINQLPIQLKSSYQELFHRKVKQQIRMSNHFISKLDEDSYPIWKNAHKLAEKYSINIAKTEPPSPYWLIKFLSIDHNNSRSAVKLARKITQEDLASLDQNVANAFFKWRANTDHLQMQAVTPKDSQQKFINDLTTRPDFKRLLTAPNLGEAEITQVIALINAFKSLGAEVSDQMATAKTEAEINQIFDQYQQFFTEVFQPFLTKLRKLKNTFNGNGSSQLAIMIDQADQSQVNTVRAKLASLAVIESPRLAYVAFPQ